MLYVDLYVELVEWSLSVNPTDLTENEQRIAQLILSYMENNPEAIHTAEGIARWWILQQRLEEEIHLVEKVIEYFSIKGILEKVQLTDGNSYYKFRQENLERTSNNP